MELALVLVWLGMVVAAPSILGAAFSRIWGVGRPADVAIKVGLTSGVLFAAGFSFVVMLTVVDLQTS